MASNRGLSLRHANAGSDLEDLQSLSKATRKGLGIDNRASEEGVVVASWNAWVEAQKDRAMVGSVSVGTLQGRVSEQDFVVVDDPEERRAQLARRKAVLEALGRRTSPPARWAVRA